MTTPVNDELEEFDHGDDPVLKAKWEQVKDLRSRNMHNEKVLQAMNAGINPFTALTARIGILARMILSREEQLDFELEYQNLIEDKLSEGQSVARKALLAASNVPPGQLDALMQQLDQFRNGNGPPSGPSGLYRGRG